jgi:hypothetical protein
MRGTAKEKAEMERRGNHEKATGVDFHPWTRLPGLAAFPLTGL